jgi:hypothetical protein
VVVDDDRSVVVVDDDALVQVSDATGPEVATILPGARAVA